MEQFVEFGFWMYGAGLVLFMLKNWKADLGWKESFKLAVIWPLTIWKNRG